jgi:tetratricopeptide (TPR) repeat protein
MECRTASRVALAFVIALHAASAAAHATSPPGRSEAAAGQAPVPAVAARLLEGMGGYRFEITSANPLAQRFFDQGMVLAWGFNFAEAERSFLEAARLDPACAICWWGAAHARGPSINHDMDASAAAAAARYLRRARALARQAGEKERTLIEALAARQGAAPEAAYARAMREVVRRFPEDADALTLLADALMVPHGRDYWRRSGAPQPWTQEILGLLEQALALAPDHPGANHFYVHVLEDSPHPERARASAQRLQTLAPGVAHLVHMPAHVLLRLGDYAGASLANQNAIAADRAYLRASEAEPKYLAGYAVHNHHFLWYTSIMQGGSGVAQAAATELARYAGSAAARGSAAGTRQHFLVLPLYTLVRFGRWQEILAAPRPAPATAYTDGVWHYARGMAYLRSAEPERAREEQRRVGQNLRSAARGKAALKNVVALSRLLAIADHLLQAELAASAGRFAAALEQGRAAVQIESALDPDEPPAWHMPARHTLGALLLEAELAADAEQAYRADLQIHPENGWALAGLAESMARQGRAAEADEARARFERAWRGADVTLGGSRF